MNEIPNAAIVWLIITAILAFIIPIAVLIIWKVKTKSKVIPVLCGAAIFIVFALVLESIPKIFLFSGTNQVSVYILKHAWAYTLVGCTLAGVFEETGRYVAFHFFLKKYKEKTTSVAYGIGHGGIEAMMLVGVNMISLAVMAIMVNLGMSGMLFNGVPPEQQAVLETTMASLSAFGFLSCFMSIGERIMAMTLHISASVLVFGAIRQKGKGYLFPVAILLHMLFDVPAAMYQAGVLNIYVCELLLLLFTIAIAVFAVKLYRNMKVEEAEENMEE